MIEVALFFYLAGALFTLDAAGRCRSGWARDLFLAGLVIAWPAVAAAAIWRSFRNKHGG